MRCASARIHNRCTSPPNQSTGILHLLQKPQPLPLIQLLPPMLHEFLLRTPRQLPPQRGSGPLWKGRSRRLLWRLTWALPLRVGTLPLSLLPMLCVCITILCMQVKQTYDLPTYEAYEAYEANWA
jgi:hypothetical protein